MADISGATSAFDASRFAVNSAVARSGGRGQDDEKSLLEQLREELREEARLAAREAREAETGERTGVTAPAAPDGVTITSLEDLRNALSPQDNAERPRGFQPSDTEDRVVLSDQARLILEQNGEEAQTDSLNARANTQEDTVERIDQDEANDYEFDVNTVEATVVDDEQESFAFREEETAQSQAFVANVNEVTAQVQDTQEVTESDDEVTRESSADAAAVVTNDEDDRVVESADRRANENEQKTVANLEAAANSNDPTNTINGTNQVTVNEEDTSVVSGNQDLSNNPNVPGAQRVLGQIVDQFA